MALPVIANTYQVSIGYGYAGVSTAANVLHVQAFALTAQEIADAVAGVWWRTDTWPAIMSNTAFATQLRVTPLDGSSTTAIANAANFGTVNGQQDHLAAGLSEAIVVTQYTDVRGRSGRGRYYVPYIAMPFRADSGASWVDAGGGITNAFAALNAAWATNLAGIVRGVVSVLHKSFHPTVMEVPQLGYIGSQRGRLHT